MAKRMITQEKVNIIVNRESFSELIEIIESLDDDQLSSMNLTACPRKINDNWEMTFELEYFKTVPRYDWYRRQFP